MVVTVILDHYATYHTGAHKAARCKIIPGGGTLAGTSRTCDEGERGGCKDMPPEFHTEDEDDAEELDMIR